MSMQEVPFIPPESEPERPKPLLWRILVEPYRPPDTTDGGIALPQEVLDTTALLASYGRVVDMGSLAYKEKTKSGLSMADEAHKPKIGSWVQYHTQAGRRIQMRDGREYVILNDDEILAVVGNPSLYKQWV